MYTDELVGAVYYWNDGYCTYCGKKVAITNYGTVYERGAWEVDHWIPLSRGGTDDLDNLCPACVDCNREKGTMTGDEFNAYLRALEHERRRRAPATPSAGEAVLALAAVFLGVALIRALLQPRPAQGG